MPHELRVDTVEFLTALKLIAHGAEDSQRAKIDGVIWFDGNDIRIATLGIEVAAKAEGEWIGEVHVPVTFLAGLSRVPLKGGMNLVTFGDKQFRVGRTAISAHWRPRYENRISLPIDAPLTMLLSLPLHYTAEEIMASGLDKSLAEAQETREDLLRQVGETLAPLGLSNAELCSLVDAKVAHLPKP